jgi:GNAT superfamily N-acetyltransferase
MSRELATTARPSIREVRTAVQVEEARKLFLEYRAWLAVHREVTAFADSFLKTGLSFLDEEIRALPGAYAPPRGALLVAYEGATPIGCAALRPHGPGTAEFKRLFVRPSRRNTGVGRRLTLRTLARARRLGYDRVVLDTLPRMDRAIALYRTLGFRTIPRYWDHPVADALFFELRLKPPPQAAPRSRNAAPAIRSRLTKAPQADPAPPRARRPVGAGPPR